MFRLRSLKVKSLSIFLTLAFVSIQSLQMAPASAIDTVTVTGYRNDRPEWMTGLEFQEYLNNQATANQLRALSEYLAAEAAARVAAEKKKSEDEAKADKEKKCLLVAQSSFALCDRDAQSFKLEKGKTCVGLQTTVGNMPHVNPAGACWAQLINNYDLYMANCRFKLSIDNLNCAE